MVDHQLLATIRSSPLFLKDNTKPNAQMPLRRLQKMCSPETNRHCGFFFFFLQTTALIHQSQSWCPLGLLRNKKAIYKCGTSISMERFTSEGLHSDSQYHPHEIINISNSNWFKDSSPNTLHALLALIKTLDVHVAPDLKLPQLLKHNVTSVVPSPLGNRALQIILRR